MFSIDESLLKQLKNVAEETNSTLFMVLLVAYKSLLAIYSNQSEIVVGTPVSGRWQIELKEIIGMFSNTLAIQSSINTSQTLRKL